MGCARAFPKCLSKVPLLVLQLVPIIAVTRTFDDPHKRLVLLAHRGVTCLTRAKPPMKSSRSPPQKVRISRACSKVVVQASTEPLTADSLRAMLTELNEIIAKLVVHQVS